MMRDKRAGKTFQLPWPEWVEFCTEHGIDPIEDCECGFDLGGGDSFTVACYYPPDEEAHLQERQEQVDEFSRRRWREKCPHKATVALNEEGNAGIYCVSCGERISEEV